MTDASTSGPHDGAPSFVHDPVMRDEIVATFADVPAGVVLDATLGGAGHSQAILDSRPDLSILGIDRDAVALSAAEGRLAAYGERAMTFRARFDQLGDAMAAHAVTELSGALFDLGDRAVGLHELQEAQAERGTDPVPRALRVTAGLLEQLV